MRERASGAGHRAGLAQATAVGAAATPRAINWVCSIDSTLQCKVSHDDAPRSRLRDPGSTPQRPLNRDVILDGAVALIEREGPDALSMRRLGATLGVEAMAIYHHFDSRDELLAAIGDRLLRPLHELELQRRLAGGVPALRDGLARYRGRAAGDVSAARPAAVRYAGFAASR